jgi:glycyl-tRNA synthetase
MTEKDPNLMEKIVSLCKRRGFIFPSSEIYGGIAGFWDYGPLGVELRHNIKQHFWNRFVLEREDIYPVSTSIVMSPKVWEASGHVAGFADTMVICDKCKRQFRADQVDLTGDEDDSTPCPECGGELSPELSFNTMLKTSVGAGKEAQASYLRPETAQGMFTNFKNIVDTFHPKLPFGMAQIGKAFRNEISPRDFLFRQREFEQMEIEYFVDPRDAEKINQIFDEFYSVQQEFLKEVGLSGSKIHKIEVPESDRAHYSKRSIDTEFDFPFGQKELLGLAYRTDYDLKAHMAKSGVDLSYFDEETGQRFVPHCIEPTMGVDRLVTAVLTDAYTEDELGGEKRVYLKLNKNIAPVRAAVFPLLKNKPELVAKAREVYSMLKKEIPNIQFDDNGNIGKRYRRQDEIGTPHCITVDFDTLGETPDLKDTVTLRDRDTGEQERLKISELISRI